MLLPLNPPLFLLALMLLLSSCSCFASFHKSLNVTVRRAVDGSRHSRRSVQPSLYWVNAPADSCDTAP